MIYIRTGIKEFEGRVNFLKANGVGAEITLYDTDYLLTATNEELNRFALLVRESKLPITVHLPMYGTDYGVKDTFIREYSLKVTSLALDLAGKMGATKAVFHAGFNPMNPPSVRKKWLEQFELEFPKILKKAKENNIIIASENVWDVDSEYFDFVYERFLDSNSKFCFDIGHSQIYFTKVNHEQWFQKYRTKITHIHVHDNHITPEDEHLHIGEGIINFEKYFALIKENNINVSYTLEVKFDERILKDIEILKKQF